MHKSYRDGMALVRRFGRLDAFITMTCNPKHPDILGCLYDGQSSADRPEIIVIVFKLLVKQLMHEITKEPLIFGHVKYFISNIEFQKGVFHTFIYL